MNYIELKDIFENGFSKNITTYLTNKAHIWDFDNLMSTYGENIGKGELEVQSQIRKIFDKSDLRSDVDRDDIHIFNNYSLMK